MRRHLALFDFLVAGDGAGTRTCTRRARPNTPGWKATRDQKRTVAYAAVDAFRTAPVGLSMRRPYAGARCPSSSSTACGRRRGRGRR